MCNAGFYGPNGGACLQCPAPSSSDVGSLSVDNCTKNLSGRSLLQTGSCAVGQVLVNSVCTYNDPALKLWYTFEGSDSKQNRGSLSNIPSTNSYGQGALSISSVAKEGTQSLVSNQIDIKFSSALMDDIGKYSFSFWFFYTSMNSETLWMQYQCNDAGLMIHQDSSNNIGFDTEGMPSWGYASEYLVGTQWTLNKWVHVVAIYNYGTRKLYYNGILKYTFIDSGYTQKTSSFCYYQKVAKTGLTDDVRIYSRILTENEIMWLYKPCEVDAPFYFDTFSCCTPGYITVNGACVACQAGTYPAAGATACANCSAGAYSAVTGASVCVSCPAGSSSVVGSISIANCSFCAVGQVVLNGVCTYNDTALKYWWKFEQSDPTKNSGSGSGGTLQLHGNPSGSLVLSSLAKEGTSSLSSETTNNLVASGNQDIYSLSFWFFFATNYMSNSNNLIFLQGPDFALIMSLINSDTQFSMRNNPDYTSVNLDSAGQYRNTWVHFVATISYGTRKMYVNGNLKYSFVKSPYTSNWQTIQLNINPGAGKIDDFRIYSRILTAQEAMWLYKPCEVDAPLYFDTYVCPCGAGYLSVSGVCVACAAGKYAAAGAAVCTDCGPGKYSGVTGASSVSACTNCSAGAYSGVTGAIRVYYAPPGRTLA